MNVSIVQSMINAVDKPAIFISTDYVIKAVNQAYADTYKKAIKVGQSRCFEVSHNSDKPCDKNGESCPIQQCIDTGRTASVVHIHHMPHGKEFCDILMKPIKDEHGITIGFLEVLENIRFAASSPQKNKMIGKSAPFLNLIRKINRAAKSEISVLLQGNTGTGKELVARALHDSSIRAEKPFIVIECSGLTESLFESELFGHEKGAFTGATHHKKGLIEVAEGGTVFFDEIGDVPLTMQVKLLRLLETHTYRSVGGLKQKSADFRFVSATHKDLLKLVKLGEFREDLYYRIAGFPIHLPALAERRDDIEMLARLFLNDTGNRHKRFSSDAMTQLKKYDFPGNIRELKNIVEQSALLADEDTITVHDLPEQVFRNTNALTGANVLGQTLEVHPEQPRQNTPSFQDNQTEKLVSLDELERDYLQNLVHNRSLSINQISDALGISARTLYRKLQKHNISMP